MSKSVDFFEAQFRQQVAHGELALNPFEIAALPHLRGRVLDFGCGLGNLAVAAARRGCSVLALDAAPTAIRHLAARATPAGLAIDARETDLRIHALDEDFDTVAAIGLLMFFDRPTALRLLAHLQAHTRPGGTAIVNVLVDGTTYLDMFDPSSHCLFGRRELADAFAGWEILVESFENFPAPADTVKAFVTVIARKPAAGLA